MVDLFTHSVINSNLYLKGGGGHFSPNRNLATHNILSIKNYIKPENNISFCCGLFLAFSLMSLLDIHKGPNSLPSSMIINFACSFPRA